MRSLCRAAARRACILLRIPSSSATSNISEDQTAAMRLGGNSVAALGSAGVNNGTAGLGAHSGTKAMSALSWDSLRLIRTLRHDVSFP